MARTGVTQSEAQARVDKAFVDSNAAFSKTRRGAVIHAFMIGASLLIGRRLAGRHCGRQTARRFHLARVWHTWEIGRPFFIR